MIYLDNSATTKPHPSVLESYQKVSEQFFANPSSIHELGGETERLLIKSREQTADLLGVSDEEIIFTSGGTEGNNIAIKGIALNHYNRGKHLLTSEVEHPSVFETFKGLEQLGFEVTYLPVNQHGVISIDDLKMAIRNDTILISIMHVNNETGSIQPIQQIGEIAKSYPKLFFHVDDVQGLGKVPLKLKDSGIDLCTFSGHKIHGLKGTGALYVRRNTSLFPLFHGGGQELSIRSGTENLAGIVAFARAVRLIKEKEQKERNHLVQLQQYLHERFQKIKEVKINSPTDGAPHIFNISVPQLKPEVIIHQLSRHNIFISTKSACSSRQNDESRVLVACGFKRDRSTTALRISLSYQNTIEELTEFVNTFKQVMKQLTQ